MHVFSYLNIFTHKHYRKLNHTVCFQNITYICNSNQHNNLASIIIHVDMLLKRNSFKTHKAIDIDKVVYSIKYLILPNHILYYTKYL